MFCDNATLAINSKVDFGTKMIPASSHLENFVKILKVLEKLSNIAKFNLSLNHRKTSGFLCIFCQFFEIFLILIIIYFLIASNTNQTGNH